MSEGMFMCLLLFLSKAIADGEISPKNQAKKIRVVPFSRSHTGGLLFTPAKLNLLKLSGNRRTSS